MRLAVLILRKNYYRLLAPVVDAALARRWDVECWHDWSHPRRGGKSYEFPDAVPRFRHGTPRVTSFIGMDDLAARFRAEPPDAVLSLDPPDRTVRAATRARWVWLQYSTDIVYSDQPGGFLDADAIGAYSAYWREKIDERYGPEGPAGAVRNKTAPVGVPELDALGLVDPREVRHRLGLDRDRPVVVYLPFPMRSNPPTFWLRHVYAPRTRASRALRVLLGRRPEYWPHVRADAGDRRMLEAIRAFCDREGAALVVKSRVKDEPPGYARRLADRVVGDESLYPPSILELLSTAALCVHFYSTAVFEAVYAGVPSLCLAPEAADMGLPDLIHDLVHNGKPGGIYNWPGAAYWQPLAEAFEGLHRWRLADFPATREARRDYVEHFLGPDDGRSSERLLDLAATRAG
ncbi:MAG TPA: hypothetical protein VEH80_06290 [Candidatus Bathyarchaeia archaeon]|nr:hypothetical protein [Candidatus Bathyarchaeia archaeon]